MVPLWGAMECGGVVLASVVLPALPPVIVQSALVRGASYMGERERPMFLYIHVFIMWRSVCLLHRSYVIICVLYGHGQWHILTLYSVCWRQIIQKSYRYLALCVWVKSSNHPSLWTQLCIRHQHWPPLKPSPILVDVQKRSKLQMLNISSFL